MKPDAPVDPRKETGEVPVAGKHTPGPWRRALISGGVLDSVGGAVAHALNADPARREADANLIAAAPELLKACELAFALIGLCRALTDEEGTMGLRALDAAMRLALAPDSGEAPK